MVKWKESIANYLEIEQSGGYALVAVGLCPRISAIIISDVYMFKTPIRKAINDSLTGLANRTI